MALNVVFNMTAASHLLYLHSVFKFPVEFGLFFNFFINSDQFFCIRSRGRHFSVFPLFALEVKIFPLSPIQLFVQSLSRVHDPRFSIIETTVAAVDGKTAKQMKEENGDPIFMLNVFAQTLKVHLASWSVHGDKTNEPGCLKQHLEELFTMYPSLKLLTGDAVYTQRPLLEAIQEYHRDYLFQVKENQPKVLEQMKLIFADAAQRKPDDRKVSKKRGA